MRKNGSREISLSQYRTTDLFLFAVVVGLAELLAFGATIWFPDEAVFSFSFMLPLVLLVMMRWGWPSVFYAVESAIIYCALHSLSWQYYLTYILGNASIVIVLVYLMPIGKERVAKSAILSVLLVIIAWIVEVLVRSIMLVITGVSSFVPSLVLMCGFADCGLLSLVMGVIAILVVRRFDGLFEDQKAYLLRLYKVKQEKRRVDTFGEDLDELDEENLSKLDRDNDLY